MRPLWTAASLLFILLPLSATAAPFVFYRGVLNAASFAPQGLPNGSIARGSIFSIFGREMGPAEGVQVSAFPLESSLAGVSIEVCQGDACVAAIPLFVRADQINAIMPSNAPLGPSSVRVSFNGEAGNFSPIEVTSSSVGVFTIAGGLGPAIVQNYLAQDNQPLNSTEATARVGQVVTVWATGLGAGLNADTLAPQTGSLSGVVEIFVGGTPVTTLLYAGRSGCCAGVDQLVFEIPSGAPSGCYVPLQVRTEGRVVTHSTTLAIGNGGPCGPRSEAVSVLLEGGGAGFVEIAREQQYVARFGGAVDVLRDLASASFRQYPGGVWSYDSQLASAPLGLCSVEAYRGFQRNQQARAGRPLDAGESLTLAVAGQSVTLPGRPAEGAYGAEIAQRIAPNDAPLTLVPGALATVSAAGGADVAPFAIDLSAASQIRWSNQESIETVSRAQTLTVAWEAPASADVMMVSGGVSDALSDSTVVFTCYERPEAGGLTVEPYVLSVLPPARARESQSSAWLQVTALGGLTRPEAAGLDLFLAGSASTARRTVRYE